MSRGARHNYPNIWLRVLLVGGVASVALIVAATVRLAQGNRAVTAVALKEYGGFAAGSYREHLVSYLRHSVSEVLGAVNHGDGRHVSRPVLGAPDLGAHLPVSRDCMCREPRRGPMPKRFFGFTLGVDTLAVGDDANGPRRGWITQQGGVAALSNAKAFGRIHTTAANRVRRPADPSWDYDLVVAEHADSLRFVALRGMPTEWGDTVVYAAEFDAAAVDTIFRAVLHDPGLLPASLTRGLPNDAVIDLEVLDFDWRVVFRSRQDVTWRASSLNMLPKRFASMHVRAQIRPDVQESLLIGAAPAQLRFMLMLLLLALGITVVAAVQLRRDVRFAADRASFVASVSHELRTPLTQVRLVLDTLRMGRATNDEMRKWSLELADREVLRLQHLVEGLLRFTRGGQKDEPRLRQEVVAEVRQVAKEFEPLAAPRGITIEVQAPEVAIHASLQAGALRQVLLNLLDNAVKYGRDRTPVTVDIVGTDTRVTIAVRDRGPGVAGEERARIWRAFERGDQAKTRGVGGSGIGLTIVRDIVEAHVGRVWVEDATGGGARFVIELPAVA